MKNGTAVIEHDYEIIDRESGNLIATFPSEQATRAAVRAAVRQDGAASVAPWLVGRIDHEGPVLHGRELLAWARADEAPPERRPAEAAQGAGAASGAELVAVLRLWLEKRASPEQQRALTPLIDAFAALANEANRLIAQSRDLKPMRSAQDADHGRELIVAIERNLSELERQRLAIRDWFASQGLPQTEEEAATDEAVRILLAHQLSEVP